ncbi:hypothetical protein OVY01_05475 [Robbsia sp. Bb-Pol-6]|uniref:Uncharacterized protein n=1 Tax=Robbsia betulipollinis TaxID=2981849 RepID=A0ABT3ZJH8_9BURK|nr:hypothetical protein [Robbsia betulipollinis]MCY0386696.1 hypothetical protein [Robbsia betulipollinis]
MNKRWVVSMFAFLAGASTLAHADGQAEDYDHGETAVARTLSPNEYLVNADGIQEDPKHRMTDVARAYRNGLIAGRKEAEAKQRVAELPPLPAQTRVAEVDVDPRRVAPPPAAYVDPRAAPGQRYAGYAVAQPVRSPPMQYVAQQNVYAGAPPYAADPEEDVEAYAPPPPVYVRPARYVYVRPAPRVWMPAPPPPMDYSGRGYGPVESVESPYAYRAY